MSIKDKDPSLEALRSAYKNYFGLKPCFLSPDRMKARIDDETRRRAAFVSKKSVAVESPSDSMKAAMLKAGVTP